MNKNKQDSEDIDKKEKVLIQSLPGRLAAKKMGKLGGRPKKLNAKKISLCKELYKDPGNTVESICKTVGISKPSLYAYVHNRHVNKQKINNNITKKTSI